MILQLRKKKELTLERSYAAPVEAVWGAWTRPAALQHWWGPDRTAVVECDVDLRVGGTIRIVTEATEQMGKYQGTRWPMSGTFSVIEEHARLTYDARSWTAGEEETTTVEHVNDVTLTGNGASTVVQLHVAITDVGPKARMAAFGMKWGYKQQLDRLGQLLASRP